MKIRLELVHKHAKVKRVVLKADTVIGRSTECGLRIASNEVSRQHCKICIGNDCVTVRDLGSSNGTFINDYQLEPETDYEIAPDSELSIGGIKFMVRFEEPAGNVMQTNGLGSTVDLKPAMQEAHENAAADPIQPTDESEDETVKFAADADATELETASLAERRETIQMTRPRDLAFQRCRDCTQRTWGFCRFGTAGRGFRTPLGTGVSYE